MKHIITCLTLLVSIFTIAQSDSTLHTFHVINKNNGTILPFAYIEYSGSNYTSDYAGLVQLKTHSETKSIEIKVEVLSEYDVTKSSQTILLENPNNEYLIFISPQQPGPVIDFSKKTKKRHIKGCLVISGEISKANKPLFMARVMVYEGNKLIEQTFTTWKGQYSLSPCTNRKKLKIKIEVERKVKFHFEKVIISKGKVKITKPHGFYEYNVTL
jgi:hypothetical protein